MINNRYPLACLCEEHAFTTKQSPSPSWGLLRSARNDVGSNKEQAND